MALYSAKSKLKKLAREVLVSPAKSTSLFVRFIRTQELTNGRNVLKTGLSLIPHSIYEHQLSDTHDKHGGFGLGSRIGVCRVGRTSQSRKPILDRRHAHRDVLGGAGHDRGHRAADG